MYDIYQLIFVLALKFVTQEENLKTSWESACLKIPSGRVSTSPSKIVKRGILHQEGEGREAKGNISMLIQRITTAVNTDRWTELSKQQGIAKKVTKKMQLLNLIPLLLSLW